MSKSAPRKVGGKPKPSEKPPQTRRRRLLSVFVPIIIMIILVSSLAGFVLESDAANRAAAATQVSDAFENHLLDLGYQNLTGSVGQYEKNGTVTIEGDDENLGGNNTGAPNILTLYQYLYSDSAFGTVNFKSAVFSTNAVNGQHVAVNSVLTLEGVTALYSIIHGLTPKNGTYLTTVNVQASYVRFGTEWEISSETWDFLNFTLTQ